MHAVVLHEVKLTKLSVNLLQLVNDVIWKEQLLIAQHLHNSWPRVWCVRWSRQVHILAPDIETHPTHISNRQAEIVTRNPLQTYNAETLDDIFRSRRTGGRRVCTHASCPGS